LTAEANRLKQFPELGAVVTEWNDPHKRELIVGNYRILYETRDDCVLIIAIVHAARDISQGIPD
jgi:plasmid stabilization system protein ParE